MRQFAAGLALGLGLASLPALASSDRYDYIMWPVIGSQGEVLCKSVMVNFTRKQMFCRQRAD